MNKPVISAALGLLLFATHGPANAQLAVQMACYSDMQKLCPTEFSARDREKMRVCLRKNLSKASEGCQAAVMAQMAANKND